MFEQLHKLLKEAKEAKKAKADVEIVLLKNKSLALSVERNEIKSINATDRVTTLVKACIGKKQGVATASGISKDALKKAIVAAKNSKPREFYYGIPKKQKYKQVKGLCNKMPNEEELRDLAKKAIKEIADKKEGSYVGKAEFSASETEKFLINSAGVEAKEKKTRFDAAIQAIAKKNGEVSSYMNSIAERKVPNIAEFASSVKKETLCLLNSKPLRKKIDIVILYPQALAELLDFALLANFDAENVIKKRSIFADKLGKQVVSGKISIIDSGCLKDGTLSSNFDDEGMPTQDTPLIENGVLKNFVNDYNTACKLKTKPTGNSSFGGIDFNNILIKAGNSSITDAVDKALLVKEIMGAHTANETTTAFSVKTNAAYLLDNGKKQPVRDVMLSGRLIEALQNVVAIGNKIRNVCGFYLPAIALRKVNVTAG